MVNSANAMLAPASYHARKGAVYLNVSSNSTGLSRRTSGLTACLLARNPMDEVAFPILLGVASQI